MICESCKCEVTKKNASQRGKFKIPFYCPECFSIKLDYEPVRDVVFLWPYPAPEKTAGGIWLPEDEDFKGSLKEELRPNRAVVLGFGPGFWDTKKMKFVKMHSFLKVGDVVVYNKKVPWKIEIENSVGERHKVTLCGMYDVWCSITDDRQ